MLLRKKRMHSGRASRLRGVLLLALALFALVSPASANNAAKLAPFVKWSPRAKVPTVDRSVGSLVDVHLPAHAWDFQPIVKSALQHGAPVRMTPNGVVISMPAKLPISRAYDQRYPLAPHRDVEHEPWLWGDRDRLLYGTMAEGQHNRAVLLATGADDPGGPMAAGTKIHTTTLGALLRKHKGAWLTLDPAHIGGYWGVLPEWLTKGPSGAVHFTPSIAVVRGPRWPGPDPTHWTGHGRPDASHLGFTVLDGGPFQVLPEGAVQHLGRIQRGRAVDFVANKHDVTWTPYVTAGPLPGH